MSRRDYVLGALLAAAIGATLALLVSESWMRGW